ncbi:hypothetical protein B0A69_05395 [Chryseobacterium shigense]|nr:hypothetical protein B0A69_05395 [Chryseobacterium shigense]
MIFLRGNGFVSNFYIVIVPIDRMISKRSYKMISGAEPLVSSNNFILYTERHGICGQILGEKLLSI